MRAVRAAPPLVVLAIGWLVLLVYGYPGQMSDDSFEVLRQARTKFFDDAHPAGFSTLWRVLEWFVSGPTPMFLVQSALFGLGTYLIAQRALSPRGAAWATTVLLVVPPVMVPLATIGAHATMAAFLVVGTGALLSERQSTRNAGLAALLVATAVQPSVFIATLPIVMLLFTHGGGRRRYATALAAWAAISISAFALDVTFTKGHAHAWPSERAQLDIAGILAHASEDLPDRTLQVTLANTGLRVETGIQDAARACREPTDATSCAALWALPTDGSAPPAKAREALARAARLLAKAYPRAYLRHRIAVFGEVLWIYSAHPELAVPRRDYALDALKFGIPTRVSDTQYAMSRALEAVAEYTPLFAPWIYLILAFLLLPLAHRQRDVAALLASGIVYELTQGITATNADYARSHWLIATVGIAVILLVARRSSR